MRGRERDEREGGRGLQEPTSLLEFSTPPSGRWLLLRP